VSSNPFRPAHTEAVRDSDRLLMLCSLAQRHSLPAQPPAPRKPTNILQMIGAFCTIPTGVEPIHQRTSRSERRRSGQRSHPCGNRGVAAGAVPGRSGHFHPAKLGRLGAALSQLSMSLTDASRRADSSKSQSLISISRDLLYAMHCL